MGFQVYDIKRVYDKIHEIKMGAKTFIDFSLLISNRQSHIPQKFTAQSGRNNGNPVCKGGDRKSRKSNVVGGIFDAQHSKIMTTAPRDH